MKALTLDELLNDTPTYAQEVTSLFTWSSNYYRGRDPFSLFLDLTGYSEEHYGVPMFDHREGYSLTIGYLEADYLADALKEWALNPHLVGKWLNLLIESEIGGE